MYNLDSYGWVGKYFRKNSIHGGAGILCRSELMAVSVDEIEALSVELHCEIAAVYIKEMRLLIIAIYRSCLGDFNIFLSTMEKISDCIFLHLPVDVTIVLGGDFNVNLAETSNRTTELLCAMDAVGLQQTIFQPTRGRAIIQGEFF